MNIKYIPNRNTFMEYINDIKKFPLLSKDQEFFLLNKYIVNNDIKAAHILVTSHLRLVITISIKFINYGISVMDLIAEGNIGLMKAIKKFKSEKCSRLSTYAIWWIRSYIQNYIIKFWYIPKNNNHKNIQKMLFCNYNINYYYCTDVIGQLIKNELKKFIQNTNNQENQENFIINKQEKLLHIKIIKSAILKLNIREQEILLYRRLINSPITLEKLSYKYFLSGERVRQIEKNAIKKLKKTIKI